MNQTEYLKRFREVTDFMNDLTARKNSDYAGEGNPFQNFNLIEVITSGRVSTSAGILVRMTDKLQRFANLLARPPKVADEAIEDTLLDLAVYSIIEYLWLTNQRASLGLAAQAPVEATQASDTTLQEAFDRDVEAATSYPMEASPNTEDDTFRVLADKVERGESLTFLERVQLISIAKAKLGVAAEGAE